MARLYPPASQGKYQGNRIPPSRFADEDGFDGDLDPGVIRLLEENARLRTLVTQLSSLVLKHVADRK